jgi:hypothetical protein
VTIFLVSASILAISAFSAATRVAKVSFSSKLSFLANIPKKWNDLHSSF